MLRCRDGTLYTGATVDVEERVKRHAAGKGARYTRSRLPVKLVYREPALDRSAALRREAALKRLTRPEKLALVRRAAAPAARAARPTGTASRGSTARRRGSRARPG
ncbi:GIY-YIG nuclease family protein [Anaeromyxobacter paludicola]|uniref:GIY-YIG nuclease family protein n=1 Tax=Anaeromyxobacter paludicola TaxID=2918171 RepID=UPI0020C02FD3|nr:GIY-YIG nuclease family protein [Anaeromyxobacter paludicola]